jgi:lipoprotein-releasing system permease protein
MFNPTAFFIGLRYTRAKRRNHFISFISMMSMIGIALGVLVLITVLSVMNGFDREIKKRVFSMWPPLTVSTGVGYIENWQDVEKIIREDAPSITAVAPFVSGQVLITHSGGVSPAMVTGIDPEAEKNISQLSDKMVQGELTQLQPKTFGIIIGEELASRLDVVFSRCYTTF